MYAHRVCIIAVHKTTHNNSDDLHSYPHCPNDHHCSEAVYTWLTMIAGAQNCLQNGGGHIQGSAYC